MTGQKGRLIVFEGTDGSGKTTQAKLLLAYFKKNRMRAVYVSFPRYKDSIWATMVRRFLDGEFGNINQVDPYFASLAYAGDRMVAAAGIKRWLERGKLVVCNRYIGSNIGHMGAKFKDKSSRIKYVKWLEKLEYGENRIPKEDIVILLQVAIGTTRKLMEGRILDIHEKDTNYLREVYNFYDFIARQKSNWVRVKCSQEGKLMSADLIHESVVKILKERNIIQADLGSA